MYRRRLLFLFFIFLSITAYSQRYSQHRYREPVESSGFRNGLDFSVSAGVPFSFGLDYVASYQFNPYLQAGAGIGVQPAFFFASGLLIPLYIDLRYNVLSTQTTPFLGIKAGRLLAFGEKDVYYLAVMPGCRFNTGGRKSISISLGLTFIPYYGHPPNHDCEPEYYVDPETGLEQEVIESEKWVFPASLSFRVLYQF